MMSSLYGLVRHALEKPAITMRASNAKLRHSCRVAMVKKCSGMHSVSPVTAAAYPPDKKITTLSRFGSQVYKSLW